MPVTSEGRVVLYLRNKHPIREGMAYVRHTEQAGFGAGSTCPVLYPLGADVPAMIDAFAGARF
jgi:hypothetical protein